jgi:imidazolonepropionase-like amidohydrolase
VTVIDATGAEAKSDMTVVITGDRITTIGKAAEVKIPKDAQVVEAAGKFLIPGLWDMHTHIAAQDFLALFIANGVTGVRDMGGVWEALSLWRKLIKEGRLTGPRIVAAGPIVDGPKPVWPFSVAVADEKQARLAVASLKQRGVDFIKVYSLLPREAYFAIADEARKQGWDPKNDVRLKSFTSEDMDRARESFQRLLDRVGAIRRAGVELLAGSDTPNPYCFPGFSLHDELALLVKSGLSPMEALQVATRNAAKFLGLLDSLGTIEQGKIADLVLLDANPLAEITNTQKINAVVANGKLIDKAAMQAMLAQAEAAAKRQ